MSLAQRYARWEIWLIFLAAATLNQSALAEAEAGAGNVSILTGAPGSLVRGSLNPAKRGLALPPSGKIMIVPVHDENSKYGMIDEWQALFIERRLQRATGGKVRSRRAGG